MPSSDLTTEELKALLAEREVRDETKYRLGEQVQRKELGNQEGAPRVTSAREWKKATSETDLPLPSGFVCRVKRPGMPKLLASGVIPDILMPMAQKAIDDARSDGRTASEDVDMDIKDLMMQEGGMEAMFDAAARVTAECVVEPRCLYHRQELVGYPDPAANGWKDIPQDERDPDVLYTDEVDFDDQMFIFSFVVGGTRDLESFRQKSR